MHKLSWSRQWPVFPNNYTACGLNTLWEWKCMRLDLSSSVEISTVSASLTTCNLQPAPSLHDLNSSVFHFPFFHCLISHKVQPPWYACADIAINTLHIIMCSWWRCATWSLWNHSLKHLLSSIFCFEWGMSEVEVSILQVSESVLSGASASIETLWFLLRVEFHFLALNRAILVVFGVSVNFLQLVCLQVLMELLDGQSYFICNCLPVYFFSSIFFPTVFLVCHKRWV